MYSLVILSFSYSGPLLPVQDTGYEVEVETTFDQFTAHIASDPRSHSLDRGNMKLTFASVRILSFFFPSPGSLLHSPLSLSSLPFLSPSFSSFSHFSFLPPFSACFSSFYLRMLSFLHLIFPPFFSLFSSFPPFSISLLIFFLHLSSHLFFFFSPSLSFCFLSPLSMNRPCCRTLGSAP